MRFGSVRRLCAVFLCALTLCGGYAVRGVRAHGGAAYYVDASQGDDARDGLSPESAWKTLARVNAETFAPGDSILLKSGETFAGYLWPKGSGTADAPITVGKYGGAARPLLCADETTPWQGGNTTEQYLYAPTIFFQDQSHIIIADLEVTNDVPGVARNAVGILVYTTGLTGRVYGISIHDCYVHDVKLHNGADYKMTGGIELIGPGKYQYGAGLPTTPLEKNAPKAGSGFEDVRITRNHVQDVAREGIRNTAGWESSPGVPANKNFRFTQINENIQITGNFVEEISGDGIVLSEAKNSLVKGNVVKNHCNEYLGDAPCFAGCWVYACKDVTVSHNEVYGAQYGAWDGMAFDVDDHSSDCVFAYNYSHDNAGGFFLNMADVKGVSTFRNNVSIGDGWGTNHGKGAKKIFFSGSNSGVSSYGMVKVYNNTIVVTTDTALLHGLSKFGTVSHFSNNLVYVAAGVTLEVGANQKGIRGNVFGGPGTITGGSSDNLGDPGILNLTFEGYPDTAEAFFASGLEELPGFSAGYDRERGLRSTYDAGKGAHAPQGMPLVQTTLEKWQSKLPSWLLPLTNYTDTVQYIFIYALFGWVFLLF